MYVYEPPPLSCEQGWELFHKIVMSHSRCMSEVSFGKLGKEMLKKCDGLPLAIVALAGILNTKDSIAEWHQVNENVRLRVMMDRTVTHMLALSYNDLPYYLKPCFLYLSIFPEDFRIPVGMLTRMWIAEGLVCAPGGMSVEDAAMQHLEELSHRFMIQVVRTNFKGVIKVVSLHDLVRDVCLEKAKELSFLQVYAPGNELGCSGTSALAVQPRRAALHSSISFPADISYLRSLVLLTCSNTSESAYDQKETLDLMIVPERYKLLRLLTLQGIRTVNASLPTEIGSLLHLRYLQIRGTNITELPNSIGKLRNLLVLDYRDVVSENGVPTTITIPNVLWKLVLLRHIFLPINSPWSVEELTLSTMPSLQTLWGLKQDQAGQWLCNEIPRLSGTVKKLQIVVCTQYELQVAFSNPSLMSDGLQTFYCELKNGITFRNVEPLCHRQRLHKLTLIGQVQMRLLNVLPINLVMLKLKDSVLYEDPLVVLGELSHLKLLKLSNAFSGTIFVCKSRSFPQLEELYLESLIYLEKWMINEGAMPCLKKLLIRRCSLLKEFPQSLQFITTLQQFDFFEVHVFFVQEAVEYGWSPPNLRLPSNFGAIIHRADSPLDTSSVRKLYELLTIGIFLDAKKQKYWVVERHNVYINCFMVYASNLGSIQRLTLKRTYSMSDNGTSVEAAQLECPGVRVYGRFDIVDLSSPVTYEIVWVVMLECMLADGVVLDADNVRYGSTIIYTELSCRGLTLTQDKQIGPEPLNQWVRVPGGEFETKPIINDDNEIQVCLHYIQDPEFCRLLVKGYIIQPKP